MKYFNQYKNLFLITLILIFFWNFFIPNYQKYIVDTILVHFNQSKISDIIVFTVILLLSFWTYSKSKIRFYLKNSYIVYSLFLLIACIYIRLNYESSLLEMYYLPKIKYFDVLFILAIIPVILLLGFWGQNKRSNSEESDFFDDSPINNPDEDILNRRQKAIQVSRLIKGNKSKTSLAIGIVGEWGNGKTSFMGFVEKSFKDDNKYIIVHFNSWLNISINSIINDFFNTVEKEISIYSLDISKQIKKYGNNVLSINKNSVTETLLNAIKVIPDNSLSEDFNTLNNLLNKLDKKVIVFFDDLDRLQPNEVFEVLKLIRNTASFDVFNYVVGYDKAYLNEALEKYNIPFSNKYYEKIFLKEFPLPPITQGQINNFIKEKILQIIPERQHEIQAFFGYLDTFILYNDENIFKSINNIRNAKRFLNEFKISIEKVKHDIYLEDFILIKLLKFSYYDVYRLLFNKEAYIEVNKDKSMGNYKYTHFTLRKKEGKDNSFASFGRVFEDSLLKEDITSLKIFSEEDLSIISLICERIFNPSNGTNNIDRNSLIYGHNYYRYFEDEISDSEITNAEFNVFMKASYQEKKNIIDKAYIQDRLGGLLLFLYKIQIHKDIKSKTEYENFIRILFYIANLKSVSVHLNYYSIDFDFLDLNISNYQDQLIRKSWYEDESEIKVFFRSIFYEKKEYYYFETDFVKHLYDKHGTSSDFNIPFNKHEIEEYLIYCFENDSKSLTSIDKNFWHCYRLCFVEDWKQLSSNSWKSTEKIIEENKRKLLYTIIPKLYNEFLVYCVTPHDLYGIGRDSLKLGLPSDFLPKLFGSQDNFIKYLESDAFKDKLEQPYEFLDEFLVFAKEVNKAGQFINFEFTYPPIIEKLNALKKNRM